MPDKAQWTACNVRIIGKTGNAHYSQLHIRFMICKVEYRRGGLLQSCSHDRELSKCDCF